MEGKRWTEKDRFGNEIYLTQERWQHITDWFNHPEMSDNEDELRETVKFGSRKQDFFNPRKYRYSKKFDNLTSNNTHIVVIVMFRYFAAEEGELLPNNFIVTAYQKKVW